jgi:hypothetical protein
VDEALAGSGTIHKRWSRLLLTSDTSQGTLRLVSNSDRSSRASEDSLPVAESRAR